MAGSQPATWMPHGCGPPDVVLLPAAGPRPLGATQAGAAETYEIPQAITERIDDVAARWGVTRFMVLHAALAVLLARLSATDALRRIA